MARKRQEITPKSDQQAMILTDTTNLTNFWNLRNRQMLADIDIINLVKPKKTSDAIKWTSNEPKVFFDTARALISLNQPRFRLPIPMEYTPEEKGKMNKAERLAIGIWRTLDQRTGEMGGASWLYELSYWILLGWYAIFTLVEKGEDGVHFIADIWNPMNVYPEWDRDGLLKCARVYEIDKATAEGMALHYQERGLDFKYEEPKEGSKPSVTNYWRREGQKVYNAILLNGILVKPLTLQSKLKRIPIHIGAIGVPDQGIVDGQIRKGESIIAANRDMYEYDNSMISLLATIVASQAFPNIIQKTRTGKEGHDETEFKGYGTVLNYKLEDVVELFKNATTPEQANLVIQWIKNQRQKGSIPDVTYGGVVQDVSGFALSQYLSALKYKLGPYLNASQYAISQVMGAFLYQYKTGNFGDLSLTTENPYDMRRGMTFMEDFTIEDVPERTYVEVTIPISSQFDKTQAILNSVQSLNAKLLSRETLWETELDVQDAEQEKERLREDQVSQDPFIMDMEIIERMWVRVETYKEMAKSDPKFMVMAESLKRYIQQKEMQLGMRQGIVQTPQGTPGIPPEQMPPEARTSPDMVRAALQQPPPKPQRPVLIGPGGQPLL